MAQGSVETPTPARAGRRKLSAPDLPPLDDNDRRPISERIYRALQRGLMSGAVQPDAMLTSRTLASAFDVSVTPVRDALKRLEADGSIVARSKSAYYLNEPTRVEFEQILDLRIATECLAIRKAADVASPKQIKKFQRLNDKYAATIQSKAKDPLLALDQNYDFHFAIYALCRSPVLLKVIETNWIRIGPTLCAFLKNSREAKASADIHCDIIDALARKDAASAERFLKRDLTDAADLILPKLQD